MTREERQEALRVYLDARRQREQDDLWDALLTQNPAIYGPHVERANRAARTTYRRKDSR